MSKSKVILDKYRPLLYAPHVHFAPEIPAEICTNAQQFYAKGTEQSQVLAIIDSSATRDGTEGLLITDTAMYCLNAEDEPWQLKFSELRIVNCKAGVLGSRIIFNDINEFDPMRSEHLTPALSYFCQEISGMSTKRIPKIIPVPLGPGESIGKGNCSDCGAVEVKRIKDLYWPDRTYLIPHIIATILSLGLWLGVMCMRVFFSQVLGKENSVCLSCGKLITGSQVQIQAPNDH